MKSIFVTCIKKEKFLQTHIEMFQIWLAFKSILMCIYIKISTLELKKTTIAIVCS